jgi:hypothetical protein
VGQDDQGRRHPARLGRNQAKPDAAERGLPQSLHSRESSMKSTIAARFLSMKDCRQA